MIDKDKDSGLFFVQCDNCPESITVDTVGKFKDMAADIKKKGWRFVNKAGQWCHYCPVCVNEWRLRQ